MAFGLALTGILAIVLMLSIVTWHTLWLIVRELPKKTPDKELENKPSDDQESDLIESKISLE